MALIDAFANRLPSPFGDDFMSPSRRRGQISPHYRTDQLLQAHRRRAEKQRQAKNQKVTAEEIAGAMTKAFAALVPMSLPNAASLLPAIVAIQRARQRRQARTDLERRQGRTLGELRPDLRRDSAHLRPGVEHYPHANARRNPNALRRNAVVAKLERGQDVGSDELRALKGAGSIVRNTTITSLTASRGPFRSRGLDRGRGREGRLEI